MKSQIQIQKKKKKIKKKESDGTVELLIQYQRFSKQSFS